MRKTSSVSLDKNDGSHLAKKFDCPSCGHKKKYVRYYDNLERDYLPVQFGRCDREEHCGYFSQPWEWLKENKALPIADYSKRKQQAPEPLKKIEIVNQEIVTRTLRKYEENNFVEYLRSFLPNEHVEKIKADYFIGTAQQGGTIFWQIDQFFRVRTGQLIRYNPQTGKRLKEIPPKRLFTVDKGFEPCFFGEHLLHVVKERIPICIVESEKTACIASAYLRSFQGRKVLWLASSGVNGLTDEKIKALAGREIILIPDMSFHARATWGMVDMRKRENEKGVRVISEDGEIEEGYISAAAKLRALACDVRFFDPAPEVNDATDIADLLLQTDPLPLFSEPDYDELLLLSNQNTDLAAPDTSKFNYPAVSGISAPEAARSWQIKQDKSGLWVANCEEARFNPYLENLINNNSALKSLIENLYICSGTVEPIGTL